VIVAEFSWSLPLALPEPAPIASRFVRQALGSGDRGEWLVVRLVGGQDGRPSGDCFARLPEFDRSGSRQRMFDATCMGGLDDGGGSHIKCQLD
jgi:hypothetical protein